MSEKIYPDSKKEINAVRTADANNGVLDEPDTYVGGKPSIEELLYYANIQRENYNEGYTGRPSKFQRIMDWLATPKDGAGTDTKESTSPVAREKQLSEFEVERVNAHRALRTASWVAMFYLITTDILGPFNAPYAFSTVGYVGGVFLYLLFGVAAAYTSFLLLYMYLRLDSDRHPVRNYGDIVEVIGGKGARLVASVMQSVQLIIIVATCILSNGQGLFQLTQNRLCFVVSIVIFCGVGMCVGQIRSLKNVAWIGSASVYLNVSVIFISMGFIAHSIPNYPAANAAYGYSIDPPAPIVATATVDGTLANKVNGAMNMVYAWGGMAEMRRPMDFWKAIACAEIVIMVIYVTYGIVVYSLQGQYTLPLAYQGVSVYAWQSVGNAITLVTVTIASTLYSNIGVKVTYIAIVEDLLKGPPLISHKGRIIWTIMQCCYWSLAFVIATAIPQVQTLQGLIGAAFLLQFSYTFPPLMQLGFDVITDAMKADPPYVPGVAHRRVDTWKDMSRWRRGLLTGKVWFKALNFLMFLASACTAVLGIYGAVVTIIATFANGAATSFGCAAPV